MALPSPSVSSLVTNSKPEASGATSRRRLSKLKQPRSFNGSLRHYSTAGETDGLRDAKPEPLVPAENGDAPCDGETDLTENIESSLFSDEPIPLTTAKKGDQPGDKIVLPSDKDYAGLGDSLRRTPKGTLISEFVNKGIIQTDVEYVKLEHGGVLCTLKCTVVETPEVVIVEARGSSDKHSSREAFRHLVSKLHLSGVLRRLIDRGKPRVLKKLRLRIEDDLLVLPETLKSEKHDWWNLTGGIKKMRKPSKHPRPESLQRACQ
ncbi:hypothetical protein ASPWEDRAFT_610674 [Aspergillus wentii DTO 134E9]|uniref:Uncharacterized protein n=1 Tax=Aspergillus wentii DTO 134E9 TaxID=1073089 RepID=A0A1L9RE39_ASPWE|nr:uncharacterized protein ASPWEDRAFT_610674 [Aspergillus wentii DTO 134E9]OJJ33148.1 hypothetical protein ASPWEDRAFT_610674 [Aspergillus wentii DTO 134E9]